MNKKYDINIIRNICLENEFELISDEYKGYHKNLIYKDRDGYVYISELNKILIKRYVKKFGKHNPYTIQNIKLWCKLNNKPFELISDMYESPHTNLKWKCLKDGCGEFFEMPWARASQNGGCGYCHGKQVGLSNCLATLYPELATEWHSTKNGDLTPYDITYGSRLDIWWKCNECGFEWNVKPNSRTSFDSGCPECNKSKGEKKITNWLQSNCVEFEVQKTFNGLYGIGNKNLSYDFNLPSYNLLIEFQGEQHEKIYKRVS